MKVSIVAALGLLAGVGVAAPAAAATPATQVSCGQVITMSITLAGDVGPCSNNGIVVGADHVTLDLHGHRVFGTPEPGDGAGILVVSHRGVTIKNGTVSDFDGGVVIEGGGGNTVTGVTAQDNIGSSTEEFSTLYGDGIAIESSSNNLVTKSTAAHNGPFSGIGIYQDVDSDHPRDVSGPATRNQITDNTVLDNNICRTSGSYCDDDGIRVEPDASGNFVTGNVVRGSALDGISLFARASNNLVERNTVEDNGYHNARHRKGDGIRVFSDHNVIRANRVFGNAANGIGVGFPTRIGTLAVENRILNNKTGGNVLFDLRDGNPDCDHNVWLANTYQTAFPPCTTGR